LIRPAMLPDLYLLIPTVSVGGMRETALLT